MGRMGYLVVEGLWTGLTPFGRLRYSRYPISGCFPYLRRGQLSCAAIPTTKSVRFFKLRLSNALPLKVVSRVSEIENLQLTERGKRVP